MVITMTQEQMFGKAKWIDCPEGKEAPIFIKKFNAVKGEKAELIISGLGFFIFEINGKKVTDDLLVPNASNYSYRDLSKFIYPLFDDLSFRTYCMKYDISDWIADGENTLKVMLGGGYYHQDMRQAEGKVDYGYPKLCYVISKNSGDVLSDKTTLCHKGYFRRCNLFYGEFIDYTAVPDESEFEYSREIETPETDFFFNVGPADKVIDVIDDIKFIGEYNGDKYYDIGVNTVGRTVVKSRTSGEHIKVACAEEIGGGYWYGIHFGKDGEYTDEYITDGTDREYHSEFSWQGFRYIKITGDAEPVRVEVIHSDCPVTSDFSCDNETANWLYKTFVHTQLCNMHSGIPSDCPHRERLGYTGDGQLCAEGAMLMLDSRTFYRKWLNDIADCQCKKSGHIQHTAPLMGGGGGPCGWGGAVFEVPYKYYKLYGDKSVLEEFFPRMLAYLDYLESRAENGIITREEKDGWCLGDWLPPQDISVPETFVNTCLYIGFMKDVQKIAEIIGRESEVTHLADRIKISTDSVNNAFYTSPRRSYCADNDGASSIAFSAGLGNEEIKNTIVRKYTALGQYDTGIIATDKLTKYLFDIGESNLAFNLMTNEKDVSFYHMMKNGATTLWENWDGQSSRNHPMFGAVAKYLLYFILGIGQTDDSCGFDKIVISPRFVEKLSRASGYITTVKGKISVDYVITDGKATVNVTVPENADAEFICGNVREKFSGSRTFLVEV